MRKLFTAATLLCLVTFTNMFAQTGTGNIVGTVADASGALIPGVTVTLLSTETGISTTMLTGETGNYSFTNLIPRKGYRITAEIPGFQTASFKDIDLGASETKRYNFALQVRAPGQQVEISVSSQDLLNTTSSSIGEVLAEARIRDLPLVGTDILNLVRIMPGVVGDSFAGLGIMTVNTVRDGLSVTDGRYGPSVGISTSTIINPDLVAEIRVILAPVDAEYGRGNGQIQITTRSGTNKYTGSANWNIQNSGLNANTWGNNNDQCTSSLVNEFCGKGVPIGDTIWLPTKPNWANQHNVTITYAGPIIKNKTFFFAQYNQNMDYRRSIVTASAMTDTAKNGIFRYFEGWNSGNALTTRPTLPTSLTSNIWPVVDFGGNPVAPPFNPGSTAAAPQPYTGTLRCFSVFGARKLDGTDFTQADCPGGTAVIRAGTWDTNRGALDSTGYIQKILAVMPTANYFGTGDGLNQAGFRYLRGRHGTDGGAGGTIVTGQDQTNDRKQINLKFDQNFNASHRLSANWSYERNKTFNNVPNWQAGIPYAVTRFPHVFTVNFTSTLSPTLVNNFTFGLRHTKGENDAPWERPDTKEEALKYTFSVPDPTQPDKPFFVLVNPGAGNFAYGGSANGIFLTNGQYNGNVSPLWSYADTLSWTSGKHSYKFGGEVRLTSSNGYNNLPNIPFPTLNGGGTTSLPSPFIGTGTGNFSVELPGFLNAAPGGQTAARANAANMSYFLAGSVNNAEMLYWINDPSDVVNGHWETYNSVDGGRKYRKQIQNEWSAFVKDDWRVSKSLTLNLGLRYEYYGSPYLGGGFTTTPAGQGAGLFGAGRQSATTDLFGNWMRPGGNMYLAGYGPNVPVAQSLQCVSGVVQAGLPTSTCDPNLLTQIQFVGPGSPNASQSVVRNDTNNFGPAIGFAWTPSFGGTGKTTIRGGYQLTYGGSGRDGIGTDTVLGGALGAVSNAVTNANDFTGQYLDFAKVATLIPVRPTSPAVPGGVIKVFDRNAGFTAFDPNFTTPYTQNFTLAITRNLIRSVTLDVRYVSTEARKTAGSLNVNEQNVFYNPELFDALVLTRAGGDAPLFDQMLAGLDLHGTTTQTGATYGPVGTVVVQPACGTGTGQSQLPTCGQAILQTGSAHLRRNATFSGNLGNGLFEAVASSLNGLNAATGLQPLAGGQALLDGFTVRGRVLRNGCDRIAAGFTAIGPGNPQPLRCFPENYFVANPQLGTPTYNANTGSSNYHSLQTQVTLRPTQGMSVQATYTFVKQLSISGTGYTDPSNRHADYVPSGRHHDFRSNGTFNLPIGPNKLLLGNSSGWVARVVEGWQTSWIYNMASGSRTTITANQSLYANGVPDVVGPWKARNGKVRWDGANNVSGTYFGNPSPYGTVPDPQCTTHVVATDSMGYNFGPNCNIDALTDAKTGQILLQNALPGTRGTLGRATFFGFGSWSLDGQVSKKFQIDETRNIQIRIDANNILNHPVPGNPTLSFNNTTFGQITGKSGSRTFQGQLRLAF